MGGLVTASKRRKAGYDLIPDYDLDGASRCRAAALLYHIFVRSACPAFVSPPFVPRAVPDDTDTRRRSRPSLGSLQTHTSEDDDDGDSAAVVVSSVRGGVGLGRATESGCFTTAGACAVQPSCLAHPAFPRALIGAPSLSQGGDAVGPIGSVNAPPPTPKEKPRHGMLGRLKEVRLP